ncbi:MAG TPA: alanine--glyoxylate aminotransferase family protein [Actinomycetota bacterium]|jgi:aspartate aminotransferase-like enzyme
MISHRSPEFAALLGECVEGVRWAIQTTNDVLLFPSSGTGGLEAAVANLLSPGEPALFAAMGWYGEMWADMAEAFGARPIRLRVPWGERIDACSLKEALAADHKIRKVFVTYNETSTAVSNDMQALSKVVKDHGCLLVVDSVSGAGCLPFPVDELGADVVVTASQKGWLAPPGLIMISLSPDALEAAAGARCPRWYFDFLVQKQFHDKGETSMTPPISVMYALREGLAMMQEEGRERIWRRHREVASIVRSGLVRTGLVLYGTATGRSDTVTAVKSPFETPDALAAFLSELKERYALVLAEGHGPLHGRIFRVGHLGSIEPSDAHQIVERIGHAFAARTRGSELKRRAM